MMRGAGAKANRGKKESRRWVVVLAGGSGRRLQELTADAWGRSVPKQFCALAGQRSLLQTTLARADRKAPRERQLVVVNQAHEHWWSRELADLPPENVLVQPSDRGTAVGLFLPLLAIHRRDPDAEVVVLPSDHFFAREDVLDDGLDEASTELARNPGHLVLIGVEVAGPDPDLGWIEIGAGDAAARIHPVTAFREKPSPVEARRLFERGALANCLILVAAVRDFFALFERHSIIPERFRKLFQGAEISRQRLADIYADLEPVDLSADLLEAAVPELRVLPLGSCGWSDLGTVSRVRECLRRQRPPRLAPLSSCRAPVDLSAPCRSWLNCSDLSPEELSRFVEML